MAPDEVVAMDSATALKKRSVSRENLTSAKKPKIATADGTAMMDTGARDAVLGTSELLESIISFLPVRSILVEAQVVSRTWRDAIAQSPAIQTRIWLKSAANKATAPIGYASSNYSWNVPMVRSQFILLEKELPVYSASIEHNDIFRDVKDTKYVDVRRLMPIRDPLAAMPKSHRVLIRIPEETSESVQPTWLDMYLTEPRITVAQLEVQMSEALLSASHRGSIWREHTRVSTRNADGLTFRDVLAVARNACASIPVGGPWRYEARVIIYFLTEQ